MTIMLLLYVAKQASVKVTTTVCGPPTRENATGATDITSDARDIGRTLEVLIEDTAEI